MQIVQVETIQMRIFRFAGYIVLLIFANAVLGLRQNIRAQGITTGSISGTIADSTGALIPGATVAATAVSTKTTVQTISQKDGNFSLKDLPIGSYNLVISYAGFASLTLNTVEVAVSRDQGLGVQKLSAGSTGEVIQVSVAQNILETSQAPVTTTFDSQAVTNLPTAGGFDELDVLIPGVVDTHADGFSNANSTNFSVNGQRGHANNFEIDDQANNDTSITGPQVFFGNDEAIAEIQVITSQF